MQNSIQKFRQCSTVFEQPRILSENLKTLTSSNYPTVQYYFAETSRTFPTYQTKRCAGIFFILLVLELFAKIKKTWFLHFHFLYLYS